MKDKKTLVIGASTNPSRYSYKAIERLRKADIDVIAIGREVGRVEDVDIKNEWPETLSGVHTITMYVRPDLQDQYLEHILKTKPNRVIFNPGTENDEFEVHLHAVGIATLEACTLVLLSIGEY